MLCIVIVKFLTFYALLSCSPPSYGIQRFYGYFELAHFAQNYSAHNVTTLVNVTSFVDVDTGDLPADNLLLRTPIDRSYTCAHLKPLPLPSHLHFTFPDAPPQGNKINDTKVDTVKLQFDAFRPQDAPHGFRVS